MLTAWCRSSYVLDVARATQCDYWLAGCLDFARCGVKAHLQSANHFRGNQHRANFPNLFDTEHSQSKVVVSRETRAVTNDVTSRHRPSSHVKRIRRQGYPFTSRWGGGRGLRPNRS